MHADRVPAVTVVDETNPSTFGDGPSTYQLKKASAKRDFSDELPVVTQQAAQLSSLDEATELLLSLEKRARLAGDSKTCLDACVFLLSLCAERKQWTKLGELTTLLFKRRSQFKLVQERMVQHVCTLVPQSPSLEQEVELLTVLRHVAEGKLFLEVERSRLTRRYAHILEHDYKQVDKACEVLQEEQVENYGGLDKREKLDFLLEQIRLVWVQRDFVRMAILARKVNRKWLEGSGDSMNDLKSRLHGFLLHLHAHEHDALAMAQDYLARAAACGVQSSGSAEWAKEMRLAGVCLALAPTGPEQVTLMHTVLASEAVKQSEEEEGEFVRTLLRRLVTQEIAALPSQLPGGIFDSAATSPLPDKAAKMLRDRLIEHNIRVVSKYYTRIRLGRFGALLSLHEDELEQHVSRMVTSSTANARLHAKIDRLDGIVYFGNRKDANSVLTARLGGDLSSLLDLVENVVHEIHKENMLYGISSATASVQ